MQKKKKKVKMPVEDSKKEFERITGISLEKELGKGGIGCNDDEHDEKRMLLERANLLADTFTRHNQPTIWERIPSQNSPEASALYPMAALTFRYLNNPRQTAVYLQKSVSHAFDSPENLYFIFRALEE